MPIKDYLYEQSIQLFVIEFFSIIYLITQLLLSHVTHSLTLQFDSYHMICKIIALTGRIVTLKYSKRKYPIISSENGHTNLTTTTQTLASNGIALNQYQNGNATVINGINGKINNCVEENKFIKDSKIIQVTQKEREDHASELRNTFGWARINVLTMSIIFVVIASLAFSNIIEAIQHTVHMHHNGSIHYPLPLLVCGACGLLISGLCYFFIGGYTIHLTNFCKYKNQSHNNVYVCDDTKKTQYNGNIINSNLNKNSDNLNYQLKQDSKYNSDEDIFMMNDFQRPGLYEVITDISSSIFVMICGLFAHLVETHYTCIDGKYIDPILAIISSLLLLIMIYPYMRESCMILLQTIPGTINIQIFHKNLLEKFQEISVHDLHIWSLTSKNYVSTVHIIFKDPTLYLNTINEIKKYFYEQGITNVSIQPEFLCARSRSTTQITTTSITTNSTIQSQQNFSSSKYQHSSNSNILCCNDCLVPCLTEACAEKSCCNIFGNLKEIITDSSTSSSIASPSTITKRIKNNKCCQSNNTPKLVNGNLTLSSNGCIHQLQHQEQHNLETLNVNNLEQKLNTTSSHTIKFNNNKNNRNFEELNGNYKILKQNNNKDDCIKESESNIKKCNCSCNCSNVNDTNKIPIEIKEQNLNENLNITEKSLNDESNNIS